MNWQDYKPKQRYKNLAIGLLDDVYVFERKIQSGMVSEFYKISKEEYESFERWCKEKEKIVEIQARKVWMRGYFGSSEFRLIQE